MLEKKNRQKLIISRCPVVEIQVVLQESSLESCSPPEAMLLSFNTQKWKIERYLTSLILTLVRFYFLYKPKVKFSIVSFFNYGHVLCRGIL